MHSGRQSPASLQVPVAPQSLKHRPSLPSLLSSQRITGRGHASLSQITSPAPSPALPTTETDNVFTPVAELHADPLDDSVVSENSFSFEHKDEQLQHKLQEQLRKNEQQRLKRQSSASTLATKASRRSASRTSIPTLPSLRKGKEKEIETRSSAQSSLQEKAPSIRKYFILTSAGKPVYTSDETDEELITSAAGVMQAIISIFADDSDRIRYIDAGNVKISFLLRAPLYYVCVSDFGEPESVLRSHLDHLHFHILSIVSLSQLQRLFAHRSNFDLRRMLEGTDISTNTLLQRMQDDFTIYSGSLEVLQIKPSVREDIGKLISAPPKASHLVYAIVLCKHKVVTLLRPRKHSVHPSDLHILLNTIFASTSLSVPQTETWIPICLPKFNSSGFLYALISFIEDDIGLVLVSTNKEAFFEVKEWKDSILEKLQVSSALKSLQKASLKPAYSIGEVSIPGLRHFIYKSRAYVQVTSPVWEGPYEDESRRRHLITLYQQIYDQVHLPQSAHGLGRQPVKLMYLHTEHECVLGWIQNTFEVYLGLAPLLPKSAAVAAAHGVTKWVKANETSLFVTSAPSFG